VSTDVLFADAFLIAVSKPVGLLTVPGRNLGEASLWRLLEHQEGHKLFAVHRLDRETSGVVLFARSAAAHRSLSQAFERRLVEKIYLARVHPAPSVSPVTLRSAMVAARRGFMRAARAGESGQEAVTDLRVLRRSSSGDAIVELRPRTGRTHQLRLQLAEAGSPIVGEPHYRQLGGAAPLPGERLWLHALSLEFDHPTTSQRLRIEAPPPPELSTP
jgi:tRNA pseudouridine32 synthase/23S rRNA pseudouridine746 synthase